MRQETAGDSDATGLRFALVVARFNEELTEALLEGAWECLERHGADLAASRVFRVPGAFEIPLACQKIVDQEKFDALVALGALIRGDTPHFDHISRQTSLGISDVSIRSGIPIAFGVLTCETREQAAARVAKGNNKGWEAALAGIEMARLFERMRGEG